MQKRKHDKISGNDEHVSHKLIKATRCSDEQQGRP